MLLEYLQGETPAQILQTSGTISEARALELFIEICSGLAYAHDHAVIHRDLKPSNIMVCRSGSIENAKLLDFGISKYTAAATPTLTQTGALLGSVNYMSPEQCRRSELDARSDIYAVGILMYETLVGEAPMQAENDLLIMSNQVNKIIDRLPGKSAISKDLERVIVPSLQKNREARFSSAHDRLLALKNCRGAAVSQNFAANRWRFG